MDLRKKQKSIFVKLFLSYILLVLILVSLIFTLLYSYSRYSLEQEVISLNTDVLDQYKRVVDNLIIEKTVKVINDFIISSEVVPLLARMAYSGENAVIPNYLVFQRLQELMQPHRSYIRAIHLYNPATDTMISNHGISRIEDLSPLKKSNLDWLENPMVAENLWIPGRPQKFSQTGEEKRVITYLQEVQLIRSEYHPPVIMAVDLLEEHIIDVLEGESTDRGESYVLTDKDNVILFQVNEKVPGNEIQNSLMDRSMGENRIRRVELEGEKYIISRASLKNGWYLYRLVPLKYFFSASNQLIFNSFIAAIVLIFAGIILSYQISIYFYTPIAALEKRVLTLVGKGPRQSDEGRDEFLHIQSALNEIDEKLVEFYKEQEKRIPRIRGDFIRNSLYQNYIDKDTYRHQRHLAGVDSTGERCCVLLLHFTLQEDSLNSKNLHIQAKYNCLDFIGNQTGEAVSFMGTELNEQTLVFLCYLSDQAKTEGTEELFSDLYRELSDANNLPLALSYGKFESNYKGIGHSYREAMQAYKHRFFYPDRLIFSPDLINTGMEYDAAYFEKQHGELKRAFNLEQYDRGLKIVEAVLERLVTSSYSFITKELCLHTLTQIILGEVFRLDFMDEELIEERLVSYRTIRDIRELSEWCRTLFAFFRDNRKSGMNEKHCLLVDEIKAHISDNLKEDLSLTRLSDHTKLSNGYLSRIFLDVTGQSLNEYIAQERMEHARMLLKDSNMKIVDIAKESGYFTPHYFSKKFKEYYGKTPKEYRLTER